MNQRMHNLSKWLFLDEGSALAFTNPRRRTVILEVNCPSETAFYVVERLDAVENNPERLDDIAAGRRREAEEAKGALPAEGEAPDDRDGVVTFLALCKGRDRLEFAVDGAFDLVAVGSGAYVYSVDGLQIASHVVAPVIFTRIANRRQRNPHLEMIEYQMRTNVERRMQQMAEESERRIEALSRKLESYAPERNKGVSPSELGKARTPLDTGGSRERSVSEGSEDAPEGGSGEGVPEGREGTAAGKKSRGSAKPDAGSGFLSE